MNFWLIDVQETLFPAICRGNKLINRLSFVLKSIRTLDLPLVVTEQYPEGLGSTLPELKVLISEDAIFFSKTTFSGCRDPQIKEEIEKRGKGTWVLFGIEAHICVLQAACDLLANGQQVIVLRDAIGSRHNEDYASAIFELSRSGARLTTSETLFYELIGECSSSYFKSFLDLVKQADE